MAAELRYVHQWTQIGGPPCDDHAKHWTEARLTVDDLAEMLGCASGSVLIGLQIDRSGQNLVITLDEHREPNCLNASCAPSAGDSTGG